MLRDVIPAAWRKPTYAAYALAGAIIGAVQVGYLSAEAGQPVWLTVTLAVYGFIGTAIGFTASANTPPGGQFTGNEPVVPEGDELVGPEGEGQDVELTEDELEHVADDDALTDAVDVEGGYDSSQEDLEAALLADVDETPVADDYEPRH